MRISRMAVCITAVPLHCRANEMKWIALLLFGGVGLTALIIGGLWGYQRWKLFRIGEVGDGQVVECCLSNGTSQTNTETRSGRLQYYPVIEFVTERGVRRRFRGATGANVPEFEIGTHLPVRYDPGNPAAAQIATFSQFWLGPLALSIFGFLFLAGGIGGFLLVQKSDRMFVAADSRRQASENEFPLPNARDPRP